MGEDPAVVRVRRPGDAHVSTERVVPQLSREDLRPAESVDEGVVVDLVEVVAAIIVGVLHERADHVRRRVLEAEQNKTKRFPREGREIGMETVLASGMKDELNSKLHALLFGIVRVLPSRLDGSFYLVRCTVSPLAETAPGCTASSFPRRFDSIWHTPLRVDEALPRAQHEIFYTYIIPARVRGSAWLYGRR